MSRLLKIVFVVYWSFFSALAYSAPLDQVAPGLNRGPALFTWKPNANHFNYEKIAEPGQGVESNRGYLEKEESPLDSITDSRGDSCNEGVRASMFYCR